ncbi:hypothetical protein J3A83DRAFT_4110133, partial [Scleroderma citrinum]
YFSWSHSAKSPEFKLTEDCWMYIRVMLSLMFATEEELGYDPTIQRRLDPEADRVCLVYEVDGHYYKTQKAIFDHRSLCKTGRATRVWEVIEVASFDKLQLLEGSHTVVLTDVWLDAGSMTEGNIQREIFADLEKIANALKAGEEPKGFTGMDDESKQMLQKCLLAQDWHQYFLTLVCKWQGMALKEVTDAAEPDSTLFGTPPATVRLSFLPHADLSRMSLSQPSDLLSHKKKTFNRHCLKRQSRVVFKQVCMALHDVTALQLMFLAGWVHRDISSGNLYWFKGNDGEVRGVLADLEYARHFRPSDGKGSLDPKMIHLYIPVAPLQKKLLDLLVGNTSPSNDLLMGNISTSNHHFVVHNFECDVGSIFWLLLWTLLVCFPCNLDSNEERSEFTGILSKIFQDTSICSPRHEEVFSQVGILCNLLARFLAPQLKPLQVSLDALCNVLVTGYLVRRYNFDNLSSYSILYKFLWATLHAFQHLAQKKLLPDLLLCCFLYLNSDTAQAEIGNLLL